MTTTTKEKAKPVFEKRLGDIKGMLWLNKGEKSSFYSTEFSRSYRDDKTGEIKDTKSFRPNDLELLRIAIDKVEAHIEANPPQH